MIVSHQLIRGIFMREQQRPEYSRNCMYVHTYVYGRGILVA